MYVYVCVCMCMYMCVYVYMYVYVGVCICMCMYVYVYVCVYIYIYMYIYIYIYIYILCVCVYVCVCMCVCIYVCGCKGYTIAFFHRFRSKMDHLGAKKGRFGVLLGAFSPFFVGYFRVGFLSERILDKSENVQIFGALLGTQIQIRSRPGPSVF